MQKYVDGYVLPVPKKNRAAYRAMAVKAGKIWWEHGALEYRECAGENLNVEWGRPFPRRFKLKPGETIISSWIVFKSRTHRDRVSTKVLKNPWIENMGGKKPPLTVPKCPTADSLSSWISDAEHVSPPNHHVLRYSGTS